MNAISRRELLRRTGTGFGLLGLAGVLADVGELSAGEGLLTPKAPHFPAKAKRVVHFFLNGGPSHVDTFDPKPALAKWAGKPIPNNLQTERKTGSAFPSPFKFAKRGKSGLEISDLFVRTAEHADGLAVIRSMAAEAPNHEPSLMLMNCGHSALPRPSLGSWTLYGLGSENRNLPGFVAMCPEGYPIKETENWQSAFLPGALQGTFVDSNYERVEDLIANIRRNGTTEKGQRRQLDLLAKLNAEHRKGRDDGRLDARAEAFELAFRMQTAASDAFDVAREPEAVRAAYGRHVHGRQTLIARRLLERGVRFVQLWHGSGQPWDAHDGIVDNHRKLSAELDQPIAALFADLKRTGMWKDTLVVIGGEFGRTPTVELGGDGKSTAGRDHNHYGFSVVLAGGAIKGGTAYGATDELGFQAVENRCTVHDLHATILHALGFDHERLTYRYAGRDFRLTDVSGRVVKEVLA